VLEFYPKFGFDRAEEWQYRAGSKIRLMVRKLDMDLRANRKKLLDAYLKFGNPHSALPVVGNTGF
jgi:hypothetical protein